MMTIHEVSKLAGVSVRTLHHYDAIDLLPPTALTEAGYRLYDDMTIFPVSRRSTSMTSFTLRWTAAN